MVKEVQYHAGELQIQNILAYIISMMRKVGTKDKESVLKMYHLLSFTDLMYRLFLAHIKP